MTARWVFLIAALATTPALADSIVQSADGQTVIETVTTSQNASVTLTWLSNANIAAGLAPGNPLYVPGINPDGSMSLSVATAFINNMNTQNYQHIGTWALPTTIVTDLSCSFQSPNQLTDYFGYGCGRQKYGNAPVIKNPAFPFSELGALFYSGLGGTGGLSIASSNNGKTGLFQNLQPYLYWSSTAQTNNLNFGNDFWFQNGFQGTENQYDSMFVLPVSVTGAAPPSVPLLACAARTPPPPPNDPECTNPIQPGLGALATLPPATPTLRPSANGSLVFDPTLNVTFLRDANLAKTLLNQGSLYIPTGTNAQGQALSVNPDGLMNGATLADFLDRLNGKTGLAPYLGHTNWQIPTTTGSPGNWNPNCSYSPPKSPNAPAYGYTCNGPQNQLGELFYDQLGGQAGHELAQTANQDAALFNDVQNNYYWENGPTNPFSGGLPSFSFQSGYSGEQTLVNALDVFLELPGDAIPEPKPIATFLTAIALLTTTLLVARVKPGTTAKSSDAADRRPAETHATGSKRFFF